MQLDGEGGVGMLRIEFVSPDAHQRPSQAAIDATTIELSFVLAKRRPQTPAEACASLKSSPASTVGDRQGINPIEHRRNV